MMAWFIFFNFWKFIHHNAAEERTSIFQCRLIDNDLCTFGLDAFHNALDATLSEVIAIALHRQAIYTNPDRFFLLFLILIVFIVSKISSQLQHTICNKIFASTVALHDGLNQVFRDIGIVGQQFAWYLTV